MNYEERQTVRAWTVKRVTLVIDTSFERELDRLNGAARTAVRDNMGTGMGRDAYEAMLSGRGQTSREEYARVAGSAVVDELREIIGELTEEHAEALLSLLLIDLLDLGDSAQADLFGDHYLPESADEIEWEDDPEPLTWNDHNNDLGDWCPWSGSGWA